MPERPADAHYGQDYEQNNRDASAYPVRDSQDLETRRVGRPEHMEHSEKGHAGGGQKDK
jgi:hypothetical protein